MAPNIEVVYAYDYAKRLYQGDPEKIADAWQDLITYGGIFETVLEHALEPVLRVMPQVTGYDWPLENPNLPVYLVMTGENFPAPLTLVASADTEQMLYDFILMLARVNIKTGFISDLERDQILQNVAQTVIELAGLDLKDVMAEADLRLREKFGADYQHSSLDLQAKSLKDYFAKAK
ncbi:hypothetical protein C4546_00605 [Candidatus Parcubacteria bacterium]|jgi:hypothetical protein|nr:MAG: hypothetical protein C4546_00605 [Candidatus Parcubacteria bacterium]